MSEDAARRREWFQYALQCKASIKEVCKRFGISRTTFYLWESRYDPNDPQSLENHSRTPTSKRQPKTPKSVIARIEKLRRKQPSMSKEKIAERLQKEGIKISSSTVGRVIKRHNFYFGDTASHRLRRLRLENTSPLAVILFVISASTLLFSGVQTAYALEGSTFQIHGNFPNQATLNPLEGSTFDMSGKEVTNLKKPLSGSQFQITVNQANAAASSASTESAETTTTTSAGTSTNTGGGRREETLQRYRGNAALHQAAKQNPVTTKDHPSDENPSAEDIRAPSPLRFNNVRKVTPTVRLPGPSMQPTAAVGQLDRAGQRLHPAPPSPLRIPREVLHFFEERQSSTCPESPPIVHCASPPDTPASCTFTGRYAFLGLLLFWLGVLIGVLLMLFLANPQKKQEKEKKKKKRKKRKTTKLLLTIAFTVSFAAMQLQWNTASVLAATTAPLTHVYNGNLLLSDGTAVTTAHTIRFSYWKSKDFVSSDLTGTGAINTSATNYVGWYEEHTITPNSDGAFSAELGSITALPTLNSLPVSTLTNLHLQIEVKVSGAADSTYDLLDTNTSDTTDDRTPVLSVPFAQNADMLDQRDTGTGSGAIPVLEDGGLLPLSTIPGGTNQSTFKINADGTSSGATLQFGQSLIKTLRYDHINTRFTFDASLHVQGQLTVTGSLTIGNFTLGTGTGAGMIRWTGTDFEGFDGVSWNSLTSGGGGGGSVTVQEGDTTIVQTGSTLDLNASDFDVTTGPANEANISLSTSGLHSKLDNRYVERSGDTMTGSLTIGQGAGLTASGTIATEGGITLNKDNAAQDAVLTFGNDALAETLQFSDTTNRFEFSDDVHATGNLTASGTLSIEGTATIDGAATFGSTITVGGVTYTFPGNDGSASGKVLKTNGAGQLSWSDDTDTHFSGTGSLQSAFDNRYVERSGDTMTGSLTIGQGAGLTASGTIATEGNLAASGALAVEGAANIHGTLSGNTIAGFNLTDCQGASNKLVYNATMQRFECSSDTDTDTNTNQLTTFTLAGDGGSNQTIEHSDTLDIEGGASISTTVGATDTLTVDITDDSVNFTELSDALSLDADTTLTFGTNTFTFNLDSSGDFNIQDNGTSVFFVRDDGNIGIGTTSPDTKLEIVGTASGRTIHAQDSLTSSGTLTVEGAANIHGTLSGNTISGFNLSDCDNATSSKLLWDETTKTFSCGTDTDTDTDNQSLFQDIAVTGQSTVTADSATDTLTFEAGSNITITTNDGTDTITITATDTNTTYSAGQGITINGTTIRTNDTLTGSTLEFQTISGTTMHALGQLTTSGSLIIDEGQTITLNGVTYTFPSSDGTNGQVLTTNGAGTLTWQDDDEGSGGLSQATADDRYVNQSGDTMTGNLVIGNAAMLSVSGAILTEGNLTINQDNEAADAILTFGNDVLPETLRFSTTTNGFIFSNDVEIQGTISGSLLHLSSTKPSSTGSTLFNSGSILYWEGNEVSTVFAITRQEQTTTQAAYDVSNASFVDSFSISGQDTEPRGLAFSDDGKNMFITGGDGADVNQYDLSAFDVSTASYIQNFSVVAQDNQPNDIAFSTDGTKMLIIGNRFNAVYEYTLSSGYDISTASYVDSFSVNSQDTTPLGITFNSDGTKMFITGDDGDDVNEYTLSTGFDVSTASFVDSFSVSGQESVPTDVAFNGDGTKMYVIGSNGDDINEYTLSTGFDVSTASFSKTTSIAAQETVPFSMVFNADGSKVFVLGSDGDDINEYTIPSNSSTTTNINAVTLNPSSGSGRLGIGTSAPDTKLEVVGTASGRTIHAQDRLTTSGALVIDEGKTLTINGIEYTFPQNQGSNSGAVLKTNTSGSLSWGLIGTGSLATRMKRINVPLNDAMIIGDESDNEINVYAATQTGSTSNIHHYFRAETGSGQLQDVDIRLKVQLPQDFVSFTDASGDLSFSYRTSSSSSAVNKLDILVEDDDGDDAFTAADGQDLANTSWTTYTDEFDGGSFDPTSGEYVYITIKSYASLNASAFAGEIVLTYTAR